MRASGERDMYSVAVLCGGESRRMGRDKKYIPWNGVPMLEHMLSGFPGCDDLFISARKETTLSFPDIPVVRDAYPLPGPLSGLCSSLSAAGNDLLFTVSCDVPLVDRRTADILLSLIGEHDAALPLTSDGRIHPLAALYRKKTLREAEHLLRSGILRMRDLIALLDVVYAPSFLFPYGDLTFSNLNTEDDVEKLCRELGRGTESIQCKEGDFSEG